ncbi:hypothetical protein EG832_06905 [bacterium]|nr:hypothetical protein [bacterium]
MDGSKAIQEMNKAYQARQKGNEGMARVLARRAAGLSIREYLKRNNVDQEGLSLNDLLKNQDIRKHLPITSYAALDRLSTRIGEDFSFPSDFDLILDSKNVVDQLSINLGA